MALNDTQLILLDNLIYLDYTVGDNTDNATVRNKVNYLLSLSDKEFKETVTDEQFYYCKDMVNGMNAEQWRTVLNAIAADETLMSMQITNVKDDNDDTGGKDKSATGFRAACFTNGEDTAVIYRGTVGSYQWADNGGELFGDKTLLADGTTAKNGFEALAQYDGNGDGIIDENEIILKFIINKQLSVGKFSLYSFALLKNAWLNDRLCHN